MAFNSLIFLFIFLPITIVLYYLPIKFERADKFRAILLLILSLLFYSWGAIEFIPILVILMIVNYALVNLSLRQSARAADKKIIDIFLTIIVVLNVLVLAWGKYVADVLPLGLSFYIFKLISAGIDISQARKKMDDAVELDEIKRELNFTPLNFSLYIAFFPELVSGPISRYKNFTPQINQAKPSSDNLFAGLRRFFPALMVKVIVADGIFALRSDLIAQLSSFGASEAWLSSIFYMLYIYLDFASYSGMAIGLGRMLGYEVPENFDNPYISTSITEFWRRWHMSLSSWFRDYVYIPLGGNRKGLPRQLINILIVWSLTGIWHGNYVNFLLWGLYHAVLLVAEKLFALKLQEKIPKSLNWLITMFLVNIGWVLFAFPKTDELLAQLGAMFGANGASDGMAIYTLGANVVLIILAVLAASPLFTKARAAWQNSKLGKSNTGIVFELVLMFLLLFVSLAFIMDQSFASFLYFQF